MRLCDLAGRASDTKVTGFAIDHRKVVKGNIFGAFQGASVNGEDFIPAAIEKGAIGVIARPGARVEGAEHIASEDPRALFAEVAGRFYAPYPDRIVAVTGTNGKTSTVEMTRQLWRMMGHRAASIGTLGVTTAEEQIRTGLTSPDIVTFLHNMAGLKRMGVSHVAFEASSHGLDQHRVSGVPVEAAAFTNFSRDHLDYHATMEEYFAAKMALFDTRLSPSGTAVVWTDDAHSDAVIARVKARGLKLMTVGSRGETIRLGERRATPLGQAISLTHDGETRLLKLPLIGAYQAANVLVAAGLALATGASWGKLFEAMGRLAPVRGRLERAVISSRGAPVYVDYAHTPDALAAAIAALRPHVEGRLITLFGAGGDRDRGKRAPMGAVAAEHSDVVIVTDDNPRSEDPAAIRAEILAGAPGAIEVADRREGIAQAIALAGAGDIVLLAGKGHEQGQIVGDHVLPFDDVAVARECAG
ncbi:UDP-N-acetylmuramoyl-L-alanyl-D-glutamate--2,6-diaminopimelate ligase [Sphingomicrobium astaxanthinifaciens]|uniref:UDP-N-acetylmuramoyl-L-alanyl-D-glutamate--2, 6-diaminopimelate ligase n=1 Tax=Sphingomicrobium astaxanthinifaciens TaxID=1227949 RepID=UPI001FCAC0E5|nr:UDP-N-acetylmuramoyl-L-alanyl-D-glutamate--2,6-diaminopimelate ligase [Sphingomicrobium astaxanthinifaciens]MCJ7421634.1 UDP-N-acetylmuramoyl-L-alanyl-D-glutamate--2,6-diaminopimelate ligase [Sphingomicrobium astaxanthinifaciens]